MYRSALAIQVASGAAGLLYRIRLIVGDEEGIDPDDRIHLVAVLIVGGVLEADSCNTGVVVIPRSTHAYALDAAEFGEFGMAGRDATTKRKLFSLRLWDLMGKADVGGTSGSNCTVCRGVVGAACASRYTSSPQSAPLMRPRGRRQVRDAAARSRAPFLRQL
jgi:hypothetical protein